MTAHRVRFPFGTGTLILLLGGCDGNVVAPDKPTASLPAQTSWGPETPHFNLEVVLRGAGGGFGLVKFRQPNDADLVVHLDIWLRGLSPNHDYRLQRAVDTAIDDVCASQSWLTLGEGLSPKAITTDERGTGTAELWRSVSAFPVGSVFDIHFRVIDDATQAVVLESECYQFTISQ